MVLTGGREERFVGDHVHGGGHDCRVAVAGVGVRKGLDPMEVLRSGHRVTRAAGGGGRGRGGCEPPGSDERKDSSECQDSTTKHVRPLLIVEIRSEVARGLQNWADSVDP